MSTLIAYHIFHVIPGQEFGFGWYGSEANAGSGELALPQCNSCCIATIIGESTFFLKWPLHIYAASEGPKECQVDVLQCTRMLSIAGS